VDSAFGTSHSDKQLENLCNELLAYNIVIT